MTSKDLPRIVPVSTSTSCKLRVSLGQKTIKIKPSERINRTNNETNTYKKQMKEDKGKKDFIRPRLIFPVKKITSVISGVFTRKKTLAGENRNVSAEETAEADEILVVGKAKPKQNHLQKKNLAVRLKILISGQRLKTRKRTRRRPLTEGTGDEELCKKRILMGERCKPMNRSGVLQYDGDGILLPEP